MPHQLQVNQVEPTTTKMAPLLTHTMLYLCLANIQVVSKGIDAAGSAKFF